MEALAVGAGDQVRRARDEVVDHDDGVAGADRRSVAGLHAGGLDLLDGRGPHATDGLDRVPELGLVDLVVAADDGRHQPAVAGHEERGLGRALRADAQERGERGDGGRAGRRDLLEGQRLLGRGVGLGDGRDLAVRGVAARLAQDQHVLAGGVEEHELVGLRSAHDPDVRGDRDGVQAEALEGPDVGAVLRVVARVQAGLVAVAAVGVLHDELAHADQPAAGARLVAPLRLEVIDLHRELAIRLDDVGEEDADDLLVGHREDHVPAVAVLEATQLRPDRVVPAARPPDVGRVDDRHLHLLAADPVLLLADDLLDPVADPLAQRQQRVDAGAELAHVARPAGAGDATASRPRPGRRGAWRRRGGRVAWPGKDSGRDPRRGVAARPSPRPALPSC